MTPDAKKVFWSIVDCGISEHGKRLAHPAEFSPCSKVIDSQQAKNPGGFHIPEPWNGDISTSRILFLSINPGITPRELYPRSGNDYWMDGRGWNTDRVEQFFEGRFDRTLPYVKYRDGGHAFKIKMESDDPDKGVVGFWPYVFKMANTLIPGADPLKDFALTELVHCKSEDSSYVNNTCYKQCMDKYLQDIFSLAEKAEYVVFIGRPVRENIIGHYGFHSPVKQRWYRTRRLNGRELLVTFVDHNNAFADESGFRAYGVLPVPQDRTTLEEI